MPHPLMFQVAAELEDSLKPEFQDYEELLPLEPGTLDPVWYRRCSDTSQAGAREVRQCSRICATTARVAPPAW